MYLVKVSKSATKLDYRDSIAEKTPAELIQ